MNNKFFKKALGEFEDQREIKKILLLISKIFKFSDYLIVGGLALKTYNPYARSLTPDLDLLLSLEAKSRLKDFLANFKSINKNYFLDNFWISIEESHIKIDIIFETNEFEKMALKSPNTIVYEKREFFIIKPEYLALMKLESMREKDQDDLIEILSWNFINKSELDFLVSKYLPSLYDDYNQLNTISLWKQNKLIFSFNTNKAKSLKKYN